MSQPAKVILEQKTLAYILFGILITLNMDCKTTNLTTQSTPEIGKKPQLCKQIFKQGTGTITEQYSYQNHERVKTERIDENGELIFTEVTEWSEQKIRRQKRIIGDKAVFELRFFYENGLLIKRELDDTNQKGALVMDGKPDRKETFFYAQSGKDTTKPLLVKIITERKNMPTLVANIEYAANGLEDQRTTRSDERVLNIQKTFYIDGKKNRSTVELLDGKILEYRFEYNADGTISEITRTGPDKMELQRWTREYNCEPTE